MTETRTKKEIVKKHEGIRKYEKFLLEVCNVEHFSLLTDEEKNGYYAVAILLAYQEGAKPNLKEFAYRLRVNPFLLEEAFVALRANGVLAPLYKKFEVVRGGLEIGKEALSTSWMTSEKKDLIEWCWVAGIGSGLAGLKIEPKKEKETEPEKE